MAKGAKEIQRRIRSVKNTRKITRAMEMVSAAKMKKEVDRVLAIRAYANAAWGVLANLAKAFKEHDYELLETRDVKKILVILVTSNRGLCGAYNTQVIKKTMEQVKNPSLIKINRGKDGKVFSETPNEKIEFDFVAVGKKGFRYLNSRGHNVIAVYENLNYVPTVDSIRPIAKKAMDDYENGIYDKVVVAYTDYENALIQTPKMRQLLPVSKIDLEKQIKEMSTRRMGEEKLENSLEEEEEVIDYKFEPQPKEILERLLPRLVEMQLYHAILESNASKESARMMAMKNATEAAGDMLTELNYSYNQIRQSGITQEIAEITSGQAALE